MLVIEPIRLPEPEAVGLPVLNDWYTQFVTSAMMARRIGGGKELRTLACFSFSITFSPKLSIHSNIILTLVFASPFNQVCHTESDVMTPVNFFTTNQMFVVLVVSYFRRAEN
jgi:hypothetical protein